MKKFITTQIRLMLAGAMVSGIAAQAFAGAGFNSGSLAVVRFGDGTAALGTTGTATFVEERSAQTGSLIGPVLAMPTAVSGSNKRLVNSGSATSEGFLTLSSNGLYLVLAGYDAALGTAGVNSTTGATVNRVIGRITVADGTIDTSTATADMFSGNTIRSGMTDDGTRFWASGGSGGVRYASALGATTTITVNTGNPTNTRVLGILSGQLYVSSASSTFQGVSTVGTGLPTTTGNTITLLPGFPTAAGPSSYDFFFANATTLYVADDRSQASGGGVQKWTLSGGTWSLAYTLQSGITTGCRGLTGLIDQAAGNTVLFATTTQSNNNNLVTIMDSGPTSAFSVLDTAGTNKAFRGLRYLGSPCTAVAISGQPGNQNVEVGSSASFTVATTGTAPVSYRWRRGANPLSNGGNISGANSATLVINPASQADQSDFYNCIVGNGCGTQTSDNASLTVFCNGPNIDTPPSNQSVLVGQPASFSVTASGTASITYQWRRGVTNLSNGGNISGADTATLTIDPTAPADAGNNYNCVLSSPCGSINTGNVTLAVNEPCTAPSIRTQPMNQIANVGGSATFSVTANGTPTLLYQWRRGVTNLSNGGSISGADTASLMIDPVALGDAGIDYNCVITNDCGTITTNDASLTVNVPCDPVMVIGGPGFPTATVGGSASFHVTVSGTPPFNYQWRRGVTNLSDGGNISGSNTFHLLIDPVGLSDAGNDYNCLVTNACGEATTQDGTLTVNCAPIMMTGPSDQVVPYGGNASFMVNVTSGTPPLSYQWRRGLVNLVDGVHYGGVHAPQLFINNVDLSDVGFDYNCVVTDACNNSVASVNASLAVICNAPVIEDQPDNLKVTEGNPAAFHVVATGVAPLSYQWRRGGTDLVNGGNIFGADSPTLLINPASPADAAANYNCLVSSPCGMTPSNDAALIVHPICWADVFPDGGNGVVDIDDLVRVITSWGNCPRSPAPCPADCFPNGGNGVVDIDDLVRVITGWGLCPL